MNRARVPPRVFRAPDDAPKSSPEPMPQYFIHDRSDFASGLSTLDHGLVPHYSPGNPFCFLSRPSLIRSDIRLARWGAEERLTYDGQLPNSIQLPTARVDVVYSILRR